MTAPSDSAPPSSRSGPGSACDECRRRKLRCDRKRPQCGVCQETGVVCHIEPIRPPRGPKKGHLKTLQTRIDVLEHRLVGQQFSRTQDEQRILLDDASAFTQPPVYLAHLPDADASLYVEQLEPSASASDRDTCDTLRRSCSGVDLPGLVRAELDQLYFERVHLFTPILHRRRYLLWAKDACKSRLCICLQHAMWALATSFSAQFQHVGHALYRSCREILEESEAEDEGAGTIEIERAQAWILVTIYEFMQTNSRRGWTSAGRAFRLVQLMRLYEIDKCSDSFVEQNGCARIDWVEIEEKRRTFWMAYCIDRFISLRNEYPLTLQEQVISTRLPAPEMEFQSDQPGNAGFLSDAIGTSGTANLPPFTECVVLATICGRSINHRHQTMVERLYGHAPHDFWDRQQWLDSILTQQIQILSLQYCFPSQQVDPMVLFTTMLSNAALLYLFKIIEPTSSEPKDQQVSFMEYEKRSLSAAQKIAHLAKALSQLSCFKAHPFTPISLILCAEFFMTYKGLEENFSLELSDISDALRELKNVNNLAKDYLHLIEKTCLNSRGETLT